MQKTNKKPAEFKEQNMLSLNDMANDAIINASFSYKRDAGNSGLVAPAKKLWSMTNENSTVAMYTANTTEKITASTACEYSSKIVANSSLNVSVGVPQYAFSGEAKSAFESLSRKKYQSVMVSVTTTSKLFRVSAPDNVWKNLTSEAKKNFETWKPEDIVSIYGEFYPQNSYFGCSLETRFVSEVEQDETSAQVGIEIFSNYNKLMAEFKGETSAVTRTRGTKSNLKTSFQSISRGGDAKTYFTRRGTFMQKLDAWSKSCKESNAQIVKMDLCPLWFIYPKEGWSKKRNALERYIKNNCWKDIKTEFEKLDKYKESPYIWKDCSIGEKIPKNAILGGRNVSHGLNKYDCYVAKVGSTPGKVRVLDENIYCFDANWNISKKNNGKILLLNDNAVHTWECIGKNDKIPGCAICTDQVIYKDKTVLVYVAKHVGSGEPGKLFAKDGKMVAFFSNERSGFFNKEFPEAEILIVKL